MKNTGQSMTVEHIDYMGLLIALSPETSARFRKLAKARGITVEQAIIEALREAKNLDKFFFKASSASIR